MEFYDMSKLARLSTKTLAYPVIVQELTHFIEKMRGLLFTSEKHLPVLLKNCSSIHSFGMSYPIDIYFLSQDMKVIKRYFNCRKRRILSCYKAAHTLEVPSYQSLRIGKLSLDEAVHFEYVEPKWL